MQSSLSNHNLPVQTTTTARSAGLPVSLAEAKDHLRISTDDLDTQVQATLEAATEYCETVTGRALRVSHTVTQTYDDWPCNPVRLSRQPVTAISSVTYYDQDGASQTVASSNYRLIAGGDHAAVLEFDDDFTEPTLDDRLDAVTITYTAGYASTDVVPAMAKHAIKLVMSELFGDLDERQMTACRDSAKRLLAAIDWGSYR